MPGPELGTEATEATKIRNIVLCFTDEATESQIDGVACPGPQGC